MTTTSTKAHNSDTSSGGDDGTGESLAAQYRAAQVLHKVSVIFSARAHTHTRTPLTHNTHH